MTDYRKKTQDKGSRADKPGFACYPDRGRKRTVDPSSYYTVKNVKTEKYAPTHDRTEVLVYEEQKFKKAPDPVLQQKAENKKRSVKKAAKKTFIWIMPVLLFAFVLAIAFIVMRVNTVDVTGTVDPTSERIIALSGIKAGTPLWLVDLTKAKADIETDPYIKIKRMTCVYPSKISIEAEERREAAAIAYMDVYIVIDHEGYVLFIGQRESLDGLIKVKGLRLTGCQVNRQLGEAPDIFIPALVEMMRALERHDLSGSIEVLDISNPLDISMTAKSGLRIQIGQTDRLDEKLQNLKDIMPELESRGLLTGILDISSKAEPSYSPAPESTEGSGETDEEGSTEDEQTGDG